MSTSLTEIGSTFYLYDSTGTGTTLKYGGVDVVAGQFGAWTPIGAVQTATGYDVAWKVAGADQYTVWSTDSNGNYIAEITGYAVPGTDYSLETLETTFQQDLNGDGVIGPTPTVIQVDGSTSLTAVVNHFYLYDSTGTGPSLKYGGADVVAGQFGAWTPIGAVKTATGYDVAWKVTGADQYTVWSTDSNGNYIAEITGYAVPGTDHSLEALEATFHQDLNGDGFLGVYMPLAFPLQYKGFAYISSYNGAYENSDSLPSLVQTGANSIEAVLGYGIDVTKSQVVVDPNYTDSLSALGKTIAEAEGLGLSVMVRPVIGFLDPTVVAPYSVGEWRQDYQPTDVAAFFASYKQMLIAEANVAQQSGAQMLCVGAELDQLAGPQYLSYWTDIISSVHAVFSGALTYSANWNTASEVSFWSQLDYEGIDCYVPLSTAQNPTLHDLINAWLEPATQSTNPVAYAAIGNQSPIQYFESLAAQSGKPLLFTELGYANDSGAAAQPWASGNSPDPTLQAALYEAFFQAWAQSGSSSLKGTYFWEWDPNGSTSNVGPGIDSFSPQNSPAQVQATAGFATHAAPTITSFSPDTGSVAGLTDANILTLSGMAEANTIVSVYDGSVLLGITTASSSGAWSYLSPNLVDGAHAFTATDTDASGLTSSASSVFDVTIDTVPPAAPTLTSHITNSDNTVSITGAALDDGIAEAGDLIKIYDGSTLISTTTTSASGGWSYTTNPLTDGYHALAATVTDLAGNTSGPSSVVDLAILPAVPSIASFAPHTSGVAGLTDASVLTLAGTAEANTTVSIYDGLALLGTAAANASGAWNYATPKLADGTHAFAATDTDSAGLTSAPSSPFNVTVDTVAPTDVFTGATPNSSGLSNSFKLTGMALDNGVVESGDVVKVYDGSTYLGSTTVGSNGTWNFTTAALSNTVHTFTSTVTDMAGNTGQSTGAVIYGTSGNQMLVSTTGNDIMTGAAGHDTFVFNGTNFGTDVVTDFHPQGNSHDVLQFSQSAFSSVAAVLSHAQQVASNVVITYNAGDTVTLQNVSLNKLTQTDFHFV